MNCPKCSGPVLTAKRRNGMRFYCEACNLKGLLALEQEPDELEKLAKERGVGVGDLVAKLTTYFGIPPCPSCQKRKQVLNRIRLVKGHIEWDKV